MYWPLIPTSETLIIEVPQHRRRVEVQHMYPIRRHRRRLAESTRRRRHRGR